MRNNKAQFAELMEYAYYIMLAFVILFLLVKLAPTIIKMFHGTTMPTMPKLP